MALTYGLVPHPPHENRVVPDSLNWAWDALGPRKWQIGVVQHTIVGTLRGCDSYFRSGSAKGLTDYGIGGITDGADDGVILMWNDPTGEAHSGASADRWPWASGPCEGSNGDGIAFIRKFGPNAVNGYLVSIERSDGGDPTIPASNRYIDSFVALAAYYADLNRIPWDAYPWNPNHDVSAYYWHSEIYGGKTCPAGAKASTDEIQAEVVIILKDRQTSGDDEEEGDILANIAKSDYVLDPNLIWPNASTGAVGKLWREYGEASGIFSPPGTPWNDPIEGGGKIFCFEGGLVIATDADGKAGIVVKCK